MGIFKHKIIKIIYYILTLLLSLLSLIFAIRRLKFLIDLKKINELAILSSYEKLDVKSDKIQEKTKEFNERSNLILKKDPPYEEEEKEEIQSEHEYESTNFKVIENQFGKCGQKCDNFYIKNITGKNIDFNSYLKKKPKIKIKNKKKPIVLIYHTHTTERYIDKDVDYKKYYPRSKDNTKNVVSVGEEIVNALKKRGINAIHDCTLHDYPEYIGSYSRSAKTVREIMKRNPEIQISIDIHRDSIGENNKKVKPTFTTKNGQKASQIMFISGCGINKNLKFPNWEQNLILAMNLQKTCENNFPGLTRELFVKNVKYNQDISPGSLLIEVGSDVNTIDESKRAGRMLGDSLGIFLNSYL